MRFDLENRVALVTGACGNIGATICRRLSEQDVIVVAADIAPRPADFGCDQWLTLDVTSEESWASAIDVIQAKHGKLDILVNNAGVAPMGTLEGTTLAEWRRCYAINVEGVFIGMRAATTLLCDSGAAAGHSACIVNISSAASNRATPFAAAYASSKAAVAQLTRAAGIEYAALSYRIRANSVHPAAVASDMIDGILERYSEITGGTPIEDLRKAMIADHPMGRLVDPDEVAQAVLFLCSDASLYVNATELHVDGGLTAN